MVEVGPDHGEALPAQQLEHLRVVVDARHRGVGESLAKEPATCAGARAEVNDAARSLRPGQVQDGCEMVAEHLGIEVEEAVLVVTVRCHHQGHGVGVSARSERRLLPRRPRRGRSDPRQPTGFPLR
ncbi:hypothetical protein D9M72_289800 [compost metagenome]